MTHDEPPPHNVAKRIFAVIVFGLAIAIIGAWTDSVRSGLAVRMPIYVLVDMIARGTFVLTLAGVALQLSRPR